MKSKFLTFFLLLQLCGITYGYEVQTHKLITRNAAITSNITMHLPDLGFTDLNDTVSNNTYEWSYQGVNCVNLISRKLTILEVIMQGAFCEDASVGTEQFLRYTNHFYDPAHGGMGFLGTFTPSLNWGLEPTDIATQDYSYKDAKDYLYKGLTLPVKSDRDENLMKTFRTLGHVMHLIEDLGQPQHTRNDSHASGSLYEGYTDVVRTTLPYGGYIPVQVATPDQFWHTADIKGLADYSNRGFVGASTNFRGSSNNIRPAKDYLLPDGTGAVVVKKQITDSDLLGPVGPNQPLLGEIHFISTPVQDGYSGATTVNSRTSSFSLFDSDLSTYGFEMVFSLNRFNFDEAHKLLIPRAVGYAAGFVNYFFRGILDVTQEPDLPGFFVIKNMGTENMSGTFALYYDDANGERKLVYTAPSPLSIPANDQSKRLSFTPPPAAKSTDKYILVFKGDLGQELQTAVSAKMVTLNTGCPAPGSAAGGKLKFTNGGKRTVASVTKTNGTAYNPVTGANEMYSVEGTVPFKIAKRVIGGVVSQDPANWLYLSGSTPPSIKLATDNGTAPVTYTGNRGEDKVAFTLTADTLTFNAMPDFEATTDKDANNIYETCVSAIDGANEIGSENVTAEVKYFYNVTKTTSGTEQLFTMKDSAPGWDWLNHNPPWTLGSGNDFQQLFNQGMAELPGRVAADKQALIDNSEAWNGGTVVFDHWVDQASDPTVAIYATPTQRGGAIFRATSAWRFISYGNILYGGRTMTGFWIDKTSYGQLSFTQINNANNGQPYASQAVADTKTETFTLITQQKIWPLLQSF